MFDKQNHSRGAVWEHPGGLRATIVLSCEADLLMLVSGCCAQHTDHGWLLTNDQLASVLSNWTYLGQQAEDQPNPTSG